MKLIVILIYIFGDYATLRMPIISFFFSVAVGLL